MRWQPTTSITWVSSLRYVRWEYPYIDFPHRMTFYIVGDLGIGLSTTVLGLFLRVLFLRRESSEQIENRVREELVDMAEATIARIRETAEIVEEGQIATRQAIEEMNTSIKTASTKLVTNTNQLEERVSSYDQYSPRPDQFPTVSGPGYRFSVNHQIYKPDG